MTTAPVDGAAGPLQVLEQHQLIVSLPPLVWWRLHREGGGAAYGLDGSQERRILTFHLVFYCF